MTGYFQQPMTPQQAEIFKAIDFLKFQKTLYFVAQTGDVYFLLEQPDPTLFKAFDSEAASIHETYAQTQFKPILAEYLREQDKTFSDDESLLEAVKSIDVRKMSESDDFIEKIRANRQALTQRIDGLAKEIFGSNVLTGTEILKAANAGRKVAQELLNIKEADENDSTLAADEQTGGARIISTIVD